MLACRFSILCATFAAGTFFCAANERAEAEPRDQFQAGTIWSGGAYFDDDGTYSHCYLHATFPEGWETTFYLDAKRVLEVEIDEPEGMDIDFNPSLTAGVDGQRLAAAAMWIDEEALWMDDWLVVYANLGPISEVGPALMSGSRLSLILDGQGTNGQAKTWSYAAMLTDSGQAFSSLEDCVTRYAGAAPARAATGNGGTNTGVARATLPPREYGAIAIGEYDDGLLAGISTGHGSYAEAEAGAIEACNQGYYGACTARMYLDEDSPCGAVAGGTDSDGAAAYGWATSGTESQAQIAAMESCSEIAYDCTIRLSDCVAD